MRNFMLKQFWSNEDGVVAPVAIMLMVVLIGFCAFVLDVGQIYATRRSLQNAVSIPPGATEMIRAFVPFASARSASL